VHGQIWDELLLAMNERNTSLFSMEICGVSKKESEEQSKVDNHKQKILNYISSGNTAFHQMQRLRHYIGL
jgi:hypothetical protein